MVGTRPGAWKGPPRRMDAPRDLVRHRRLRSTGDNPVPFSEVEEM